MIVKNKNIINKSVEKIQSIGILYFLPEDFFLKNVLVTDTLHSFYAFSVVHSLVVHH